MTKKARHLIDKVIKMETLLQGANDATSVVKDKEAWYVKQFLKNETANLEKIQSMIILREYPTKPYRPRVLHAKDKDRVIYPQHFMPWNILYHAIKVVFEPIVEKILIYDSSAGRKGKGQVFAALRTEQLLRKHTNLHYVVKLDIRKFYPSLPHKVIMNALRRYIDDDLFLELIEKTVLDYESDIEPLLLEEDAKKRATCPWTSNTPLAYVGKERGITLGNCINQIIGNLVLSEVDRYAKQKLHIEFYHRHCDDIVAMVRTKEEANELLRCFDDILSRMGMVVKCSSYVAPLMDESKLIDGRSIDFVGYVFSRKNMRMRKRTKLNMVKSFHGVKSRKRRKELYASYWGIAKWGKCTNLWNTILKENDMSFKEHGITTSQVNVDKDGKRVFDVQEKKLAELAQTHVPIIIHDFEDNVTIANKSGRCWVMFSFKDDANSEKYKFCTTSKRIIEKLNLGMQQNIYPLETFASIVFLRGGNFTYDLD